VPQGRYPLVVLFVEVPLQDLDVNVHPSKTQVCFREPGLIRGLVLAGIKEALHRVGHRSSGALAQVSV